MRGLDRARPTLLLALIAATALVAAAPASAAVPPGTTLTCGEALLGEASNYNVFVNGPYNANAISIRGGLAAAGNITINSLGLATALPPDPTRYALVGGANLTIGGGGAQAHNGSVRYAGTRSGNITVPNGAVQQGDPPFVFADQFTALRNRSTSIGSLTPVSGTVEGPTYGALTLTSDDPDGAVFELDLATLNATQVIRLRVRDGATTIINIPGGAYSSAVYPLAAIEIWNGSAYTQAGDSTSEVVERVRQRLLWNFPQATDVRIGPNLAWQGTVLAPRALVHHTGGQLNGTIIAASMSDEVHGSANWHPFVGCAPIPLPRIAPTLTCVEDRGEEGLAAHFGYTSPATSTVQVGVGPNNRFTPTPPDRGQPTSFQPGAHPDQLVVPFAAPVTWHLPGGEMTASTSSPRCSATIRIDKVLAPTVDEGRFDLLLDGQVEAEAVRAPASTGSIVVAASSAGTTHLVAEQAAVGTSLDDYTASILCRDGGGDGDIIASGTTTSLELLVHTGQSVACTITNVRRDLPPPLPGTSDLTVVKDADRASATVGDTIRWNVSVTNHGPDDATGVILDDDLPDGVSFIRGSLELPAGVTCAAGRCEVGTMPAGTTINASFLTLATAVGLQVNAVAVAADQTDPNPADNGDTAPVSVGGGASEQLTPVLECVERLPNGRLRAHLGYLNAGAEPVIVPVGPRNRFTPPEDRGQPTSFAAGRVVDVVQVDYGASEPLVWTLGSEKLQISGPGRPQCDASVRIDKLLTTPGDPGRFQLTIEGVPAGGADDVGDGGTTGDVAVSATPGGTRYLVGEEGAQGTQLAAYDITTACRNRQGQLVASYAGPQLSLTVHPGDAIVCTIRNERRSGPQVPPDPEPPVGPTGGGGGSEIVPLPPSGSPDLQVTKSASPATITVGSTVTWTARVTNTGTAAATSVVLLERPQHAGVLTSLKTTTGSCAAGSCQLGTVAPGQTVTVTATARVFSTGDKVNGVLVSGAEADANPASDVASSLVRVIGQPYATTCERLTATPRSTSPGQRNMVRITATNRLGGPLVGAAIRARGAGISLRATTDRTGRARLTIRPRQAGLISIAPLGAAVDLGAPGRCLAAVVVLLGVTG